MAWVPAAVAGVASLASTAMTNSANAGQNKAQREWSTMMSNTEMQRRVADLKAAGLNPMLAGMNQQGASYSTPSNIPMQKADVGEAVGSAFKAYMARAEKTAIELSNANALREGELLEAQKVKTLSEGNKADADALLAGSQARVNDATIGKVVADTEFATTSSANAKAQQRVIQQQYNNLVSEGAKIAAEAKGAALSNELQQRLLPLVQELHELEVKRERLQLPRLQNESNAQDSWWMKKVSPYLPDVLKSTGAAAGARSVLK